MTKPFIEDDVEWSEDGVVHRGKVIGFKDDYERDTSDCTVELTEPSAKKGTTVLKPSSAVKVTKRRVLPPGPSA